MMFQSRAQGLMKQVQDLHEQLEQTYVECKTFENLRQHEIGAIPKRMEVSPLYGKCTKIDVSQPSPECPSKFT